MRLQMLSFTESEKILKTAPRNSATYEQGTDESGLMWSEPALTNKYNKTKVHFPQDDSRPSLCRRPASQTYRQADRQTEGWMEGWTNRRTDRWVDRSFDIWVTNTLLMIKVASSHLPMILCSTSAVPNLLPVSLTTYFATWGVITAARQG